MRYLCSKSKNLPRADDPPFAMGPFEGALNFTNGETVAVKQIQLASIPKAELGEIMVGLPPSLPCFACPCLCFIEC